jgi:Protein of unknown function (DUF4240)
MDETQFWSLIEAAHRGADGDGDAQLEEIRSKLETLSEAEILEWGRHFEDAFRRSYRADLWGAAYIVNGGCSDDGFDYFRGWLIAQGRAVFERALKNPDSLADIVPADAEADFGFELEEMLHIAREAFIAKTGLEWDAGAKSFLERLGAQRDPLELVGDLEAWSTDGDADPEKCPALYPKLWEKFDWS